MGGQPPFRSFYISTMAFSGTRYVVTYDDGDNTNTQRLEVVAETADMAEARAKHLFPSAQNVVVAAA